MRRVLRDVPSATHQEIRARELTAATRCPILRKTLEGGLVMETLSYAPYRGFTIDVHVVASRVVSLVGRHIRRERIGGRGVPRLIAHCHS